MTAYYNENDPFAAAWLRELIKKSLIAPGEVDERSIEEVRPEEVQGFTQCHFFAGIGVWSCALRAAGWPDDLAVWTGSCPCQGFSASGKREGFSDKRHLWPSWFRLIRECRPDTIFGEQVSSKDGLAWFDVVSADLENEAYTIGAIDTCAAGVGAPHIRQRLYFVADSQECGASDSAKARQSHAEWNSKSGERSDSHGRGSQNRWPKGAFTDRNTSDDDVRSTSPELRVFGNTEILRRIGRPDNGDAGRREFALGYTGEASDREHANGAGPQQREQACTPLGYGSAAESASGARDDLNPEQSRLEGLTEDVREWRGPGWLDPLTARSVAAAGATRGFWNGCDWWYGRDGKYRPIGPGLFPLAASTPGRVGRLRGYGNALCAPQAIAFIESYIEIIGDSR